MSFSAFLKTLWFLAMLFIVLYTGMNNLQVIDFNFPIAGTTAKNRAGSADLLRRVRGRHARRHGAPHRRREKEGAQGLRPAERIINRKGRKAREEWSEEKFRT